MAKHLAVFVLMFIGLVSLNAYPVVELNEFSSETIRIRYNALIEELRCPKCQNQNLAGSDSTVSEDLRREVLIMLEDGYSDTEIRTFMRERYGDFILYNPPMEGKTLLVWVLPAVFLIFAVAVITVVVRSATKNAALYPEGDLEQELDNQEANAGIESTDREEDKS